MTELCTGPKESIGLGTETEGLTELCTGTEGRNGLCTGAVGSLATADSEAATAIVSVLRMKMSRRLTSTDRGSKSRNVGFSCGTPVGSRRWRSLNVGP